MRRSGEEKRKNRRKSKNYDTYRDKREEEETLPRRWCADASSGGAVRGGARRRLGSGRWRRRQGQEKNAAEGKTGAPFLLFMGGRRRSWVRDLLRTIP